MKIEQVVTLIKAVSESSLTSFQYNEGETNLVMKTVESYTTGLQEEGVKVISQTNEIAHTKGPNDQELLNDQEMQNNQEIRNTQTMETTTLNTEPMKEGTIVKSPLVGVFYSSASEECEPFVSVGSKVTKGQTLAIVEAMKLMNEIMSEQEGEIAEIFVKNGETVEYGQPLFQICEKGETSCLE